MTEIDWQPITSAPRGSPLFLIDGPILMLRFDCGHEERGYFGIGQDGVGPRWNDLSGLAMQQPALWARCDS